MTPLRSAFGTGARLSRLLALAAAVALLALAAGCDSSAREADRGVAAAGPPAGRTSSDAPGWRLRRWRGREDHVCVQPGNTAPGEPFGIRFATGQVSRWERHVDPVCGPGADRVVTVVDDPTSKAPRVVATLVYGILPRRARPASAAVSVLTDAGERRATVGRSSEYLAVLPSSDDPLQIATRVRMGRRRSTVLMDTRAPDGVRVQRSLRTTAGVPTADGGPPLALAVWRSAGRRVCLNYGWLVGGLVQSATALSGLYAPAPLTRPAGCIPRSPSARSFVALGATMPEDGSGRSDVAGQLLVFGVAGRRVHDLRVLGPTPADEAEPVREEQTGAFLALQPVTLRDPDAGRLAQRLSGSVRVEARLQDGRVTSRRPRLP